MKKKYFEGLPSCYAGKILKIDLTERTTSVIPTEKYANDYVGGRAMANRLYWDEVKDGNVPALSAENTMIYLTGPLCGTGLPYAGRTIMTGISAKNIPEQYTHASSGGYFGAVLKWAGYDGFMLTGKADKLCYVLIDDDKVTFEDAEDFKGMYVIDTQEKFRDIYGKQSSSLVIGPAGENLCRHASIETHADCAFAMPGFGAVWGYKNLKAVVARGTGTIAPMDIDKVLEIHQWADTPEKGKPYPPVYKEEFTMDEFTVPSVPYYAQQGSCNPGCNHICQRSRAGVPDPLAPGRKVTMVGKCMDMYGGTMRRDNRYPIGSYVDFPRQAVPGKYQWQNPVLCDPDDPLADVYMTMYPGNKTNMWGPNSEFGDMMMWCCNQYGLDKWDTAFWLFTWIYSCEQAGLFREDGIDFGRPIDFEDPQFAKYIIDCMVYRQGPMGELLAEGVGRMIRKLGIERYGRTINHNMCTDWGEERIIPVSWETSWGECSHWQGRGFQGCEKSIWVGMNLLHMIGSRDEANGAHSHYPYEEYIQFRKDPCHSELCAKSVWNCIRRNEMKDTLLLCEYKDPDPGRPNMELDMYKAATGAKDMTLEDIDHLADRGKIIERAIFMRDHNRTRDLEVIQVYPWMTYPDPWGDTVTWDEWNDMVDIFYKNLKWDISTGWPTKEAWEEVELDDIAEFFEKKGKIPTPDPGYVRKPNPIDR